MPASYNFVLVMLAYAMLLENDCYRSTQIPQPPATRFWIGLDDVAIFTFYLLRRPSTLYAYAVRVCI